MNNIFSENEQFINIEPQISYYSSSMNSGVMAKCSKNDKKQNKIISNLFSPVSPKNNFSLCNTIMIPFIINKEGIESYNNNYHNNKTNHSISIINDKELNQNSLKIDNTRNKTISSKTENKENEDNLDEKINQNKNNMNYEKNPFFLGKNFSTNYLNNKSKIKYEDFNLKLSENENNKSKNEGELKGFINRNLCKSVNINEGNIKSNIMREERKKKKTEKYLKMKNVKIKESWLNKKEVEDKDKIKEKDNLKRKFLKKKSFFSREQSKSYVEKVMKDKVKKTEKSGKCTNFSGGDKKIKSYYYSNKMVPQNYNEKCFKSMIKKKILEKSTKDNGGWILGKTERKKKIKKIFFIN